MRVCDWKQSSDEDRFNFILIKSKATIFNKIWNVSHAINDYFFICVDFQVNESLEHQITEVKCLFKLSILTNALGFSVGQKQAYGCSETCF